MQSERKIKDRFVPGNKLYLAIKDYIYTTPDMTWAKLAEARGVSKYAIIKQRHLRSFSSHEADKLCKLLNLTYKIVLLDKNNNVVAEA